MIFLLQRNLRRKTFKASIMSCSCQNNRATINFFGISPKSLVPVTPFQTQPGAWMSVFPFSRPKKDKLARLFGFSNDFENEE